MQSHRVTQSFGVDEESRHLRTPTNKLCFKCVCINFIRVRNKRNKITNTLYNPMELFIKQRRHCGVLMKLYYGSYTLNDSCGSSHVRTYAQTKMKSDLCMLLHHALHWAVYETSQFMRLWYLSHMQPAKAQTSLHICTVLPGA